jgi:uncharacterized protein (DUF2147 family)
MKAAAMVVVLAVLAATAASPADARPDIAGEWWTPGFNARVRIEACGDALCGRIAWVWDETPKGIADRGPLLGRLVVDRMRPVEPERWAGGRLYNPEDGRDYAGSLHLQTPDRLVVDGCVLFVCRTQVWRRADPGRCPPVTAP